MLGPGVRDVLYMQGCGLRCSGCLVPDWLDPDGGREVATDAVAAWLASRPNDLTLSGGEPTQQAPALVDAIDAARATRDFGVMAFTGHRLEALRRHGTPAQKALLDRIDLLVDGPYVARWHRPLRWRASTNQRLLLLTDRYSPEDILPDEPAGIDIVIGRGGDVRLVGVPPVPRVREALEGSA